MQVGKSLGKVEKSVCLLRDMDVSKNKGTPKWMVYNGQPYKQMDDLGVPLFSESSIWYPFYIPT